MHKALEVWWRTVSLEQALATLAAHASDQLDLIKAQELMRGYHIRWMDEPFHVLAVEEEFVTPLVNPDTGKPSVTWQRGGKIDAIARVGDAEPRIEDASLHATAAA
jgi:hypothetical protein